MSSFCLLYLFSRCVPWRPPGRRQHHWQWQEQKKTKMAGDLLKKVFLGFLWISMEPLLRFTCFNFSKEALDVVFQSLMAEKVMSQDKLHNLTLGAAQSWRGDQQQILKKLTSFSGRFLPILSIKSATIRCKINQKQKIIMICTNLNQIYSWKLPKSISVKKNVQVLGRRHLCLGTT